MWKSTRLAQYNDFMKNRKKDKIKMPNKMLSSKKNELDLHDATNDARQVTAESNECDLNLEKGINQSGRQYISSRTNAGVGMILELLKQESPGKEQEGNVPTVLADIGIEIDSKQKLFKCASGVVCFYFDPDLM